MYHSRNYNSKLAILLQQKERIFHTQDLAVLWGISNSNTLYTTIKRYVQKKILHRLFKGLYATVPLNKIDPMVLGAKVIHGFSYISCETILQKYGLLNPLVREIAFISSLSKRFSVGPHFFRSRKLHDRYLFNPYGIITHNGMYEATRERAIADMLYCNPRFHFDADIDWGKIRQVQKNLGYPLTLQRYAHS